MGDARSDSPVASAVSHVFERVAAAAQRVGRDPEEVRVVAAVKGVDVPVIREAVRAGITDLGENIAKHLWTKAEEIDDDVRWHYLGAVQTNKIRYLDPVVCVQSVDRLREAAALQSRGERTDRSWDVLVEVNVAGEAQKQGIPPDEMDRFLEGLRGYPLVVPRGLMFVAPLVENAEDVRGLFAQARDLRERFAAFGLEELSMGMSDDFEVAIEEGATIVRIGRAIFSPREDV